MGLVGVGGRGSVSVSTVTGLQTDYSLKDLWSRSKRQKDFAKGKLMRRTGQTGQKCGAKALVRSTPSVLTGIRFASVQYLHTDCDHVEKETQTESVHIFITIIITIFIYATANYHHTPSHLVNGHKLVRSKV